MPTTPSGTRTPSLSTPFRRVQSSMTVPTGSARSRMTSIPEAIASMRESLRVRRSRNAPEAPFFCASAKSSALAARMRFASARSAAAIRAKALLFCAAGASARTRAAARASRPIPAMTDARSPAPSTLFSGALIALTRSHTCHGASITAVFRLRDTESLGMADGCCPLMRRFGPTPPCAPMAKSSRLFAAQHEIVAVDHLGPAGKPQDREDVGGRTALDLLGVRSVIGDEATADFGAVRAAHDHRVAPPKRALNLHDAGRQQAFSRPQRAHRARVDVQDPARLERARDPFFPRGHRIGRRQEPGAGRTVGDALERMRHAA